MIRPIMNQWLETGRMPGMEEVDLRIHLSQQ